MGGVRMVSPGLFVSHFQFDLKLVKENQCEALLPLTKKMTWQIHR